MNVFNALGSRALYQWLSKWVLSWRAHDDFWQSLCVLAAMSLSMAVCGFYGQMARCIPLFLGIIACGLSERDERPRQRIVSLPLTLGSFAIAIVAIELLMPHPWLFIVGLGSSSFIITLFGGVGGRFNTMMMAMLVLALYSMITIDQRQEGIIIPFWRDGVLLLIGALGYGLLSLGVLTIAHRRALPRHLSVLYTQLGHYLVLRSELFTPIKGQDLRHQERQLAELHGALVQSFALSHDNVMQTLATSHDNVMQTLATSHNSVRAARDKLLLERAEQVFERAASFHQTRHVLVNAFYHSDVLFRCQRLMKLQGEACCSLAAMLHRPEQVQSASSQRTRAYQDLLSAWYYIDPASERQEIPQPRQGAHQVLQHLIDNLSALEQELVRLPDIAQESLQASHHAVVTIASAPRMLWTRFVSLLTFRNPTFRHAIRLSCALMAGYTVIQWWDPSQGYWIMLTTVFVCRPTFGATHKALRQRIMGTLAGLFIGWAMLRLFPIPELQAGMAVVAGVLFFLLRHKHYALATCAITLMVLCCFNQVGNSFTLIWPRLLDTLIGTLIASAAVCFILPDWKRLCLDTKIAAAFSNMADYLVVLAKQYAYGAQGQDVSGLLMARQQARHSDVELLELLSNLSHAPYRSLVALTGAGYQLHAQLHALLGYLTALRVHRPEEVTQPMPVLIESAQHIAEVLKQMAVYTRARNTDSTELIQAIHQAQHHMGACGQAPKESAQRFAYEQLEAMTRHFEPLLDAVEKMHALLLDS